MKRTITAALLGLLCAAALSGCHTPHREAAWEYKQIYSQLGDNQLSAYAKEGWQVHQVLKGRDPAGSEWTYVLLKRQVPVLPPAP